MSRTNFSEVAKTAVDETMEETLDTLIPKYAENKTELDSYKKICDRDNAKIKELMEAENLKAYSAGGYKATKSVSTKESFKEDLLIDLLKTKLGDDTPIIKTKEYVDMDALEKAIYNHEISTDLLLEMDKCKEVKETVTLRITKEKK